VWGNCGAKRAAVTGGGKIKNYFLGVFWGWNALTVSSFVSNISSQWLVMVNSS
jgi:hypothetical protein